jgi:DNA repair exonuclease SbcCD ATPase subunit
MIKSVEMVPRKAQWLLLGFVCTVGIFLALHSQTSAQLSRQKQEELTQVSHRVAKLEQASMRQPSQLTQLQVTTNEQLAKLTRQLHTLQVALIKHDEQAAEQEQRVNTFGSSLQELSTHVNQVQSQVKNLGRQMKNQAEPHYLSSSLLPFRVVGIDIWNGSSKVTVKLHDELNLMAVNDSLAGWTLINVSVEPAVAIFKSRHGQFVKVTF